MLSKRELETLTASLSRLEKEAGRVLALVLAFAEAPVEAMTASVSTSALCEALANADEDLCQFAGEDRLDLTRPFVRRTMGAA
jgi:hypothetical protein